MVAEREVQRKTAVRSSALKEIEGTNLTHIIDIDNMNRKLENYKLFVESDIVCSEDIQEFAKNMVITKSYFN